MTGPGRTGPGYTRVRIDVKLAWGTGLHAGQPGQVHESLAGVDLTGPFTARPGLDAVIAVEPHGRDLERELLVIRRTVTRAGDGLEQITPETIAPPTHAEITALNAALDYLGYTGPRRISLLLAVHHA